MTKKGNGARVRGSLFGADGRESFMRRRERNRLSCDTLRESGPVKSYATKDSGETGLNQLFLRREQQPIIREVMREGVIELVGNVAAAVRAGGAQSS